MSLELKNLEDARKVLMDNAYVVETPLLHAPSIVEDQSVELYLKLENTQLGGSFKMRGVANCFHKWMDSQGKIDKSLVTMSAGNYGKSFAMMVQKVKCKGLVCIPETAPSDRVATIKSFGVDVKLFPSSELMTKVNHFVDNHGMTFCHPFDDIDLICGHASVGLEILEQQSLGPDDIVVVCCGGGGLLAGIASALRLSGCKARIVGVEPEGAPGQYNSRDAKKAVTVDLKPTIASGLSPPFAGENCFDIIDEHVDDLVLVCDDEIRVAMKALFNRGLVSEPSGAAALAAVLSGKLGDISNRKVVCTVSGGNITPADVNKFCSL
mmetsp:Transcript_17909/g.29069  ORF Transcript_17909/g.29069 Transcript_17909/m.29069 type:complete len:323 (+) Transcript_17909:270-1238(+)